MNTLTAYAAAILLADFTSGLVHWFEDAYVRADTPVLGKWLGEANILHHTQPRAICRKSWWGNVWDLYLVGALVLLAAWWGDWLSGPVLLYVLLSSNANLIHRFSHQNAAENGRLVTTLQDWRILQTRRHHAQHHQGERNSHYCAVTNVLNPVLDGVGVWKTLERGLARAGLHRKPEPA